MKDDARLLVFQTAFPGDVVLALPVVQAVKKAHPRAHIGFVATPAGASLLQNHPAISSVLVFDKRGEDRGAAGLRRSAARLREEGFEVAVVPHRSIRSAFVTALAGIPCRIGFSSSAGRMFLTERVSYDRTAHEIDRNLSLLGPLGLGPATRALPSLYPSGTDVAAVDTLIRSWRHRGGKSGRWVALAPGSVWATKRWPAAHYVSLARMLVEKGRTTVIIGGAEDRPLGEKIAGAVGGNSALNAAGSLTLLQSAEFIRRCDLLVSNDSAPMHLAVAMRVPVVALFGPTIPAFGFAPLGASDIVLGLQGLRCRGCRIHGGPECPVGTFECMIALSPGEVFRAVESLLVHSSVG
jgi:heptosyltransferase-2